MEAPTSEPSRERWKQTMLVGPDGRPTAVLGDDGETQERIYMLLVVGMLALFYWRGWFR